MAANRRQFLTALAAGVATSSTWARADGLPQDIEDESVDPLGHIPQSVTYLQRFGQRG